MLAAQGRANDEETWHQPLASMYIDTPYLLTQKVKPALPTLKMLGSQWALQNHPAS